MDSVIIVFHGILVLVIDLNSKKRVFWMCQENRFWVIKYFSLFSVLGSWHDPLPLIRHSHVLEQLLVELEHNSSLVHIDVWPTI
nr:hypothetical protein Iba_chr05dCG1160 [Ipomoea batatas]GME18425.1 hypothetical protein Iba_scaffold20579CG0020 [Ipomoea batatas]